MPSGGHNAKPESVLKIHGDYRADRHANRGPKTGGEPLRKPETLGDIASRHWDMITRTRAAWLASSDCDTLKRLCQLWELSEIAMAKSLVEPEDKMLRLAAVQYHAEWSKLAARFGLTPSDRARLGENLEERRKDGEIEDMLA